MSRDSLVLYMLVSVRVEAAIFSLSAMTVEDEDDAQEKPNLKKMSSEPAFQMTGKRNRVALNTQDLFLGRNEKAERAALLEFERLKAKKVR